MQMSSVYVDPDFVALRNTRPTLTRQDLPTLPENAESNGKSSSHKKNAHVHFEDSPTEVSPHYPAHKAASMSSTTGSVYIDPIGLHGPLARPVLNTTTEPHSPRLPSHRSRSPIISSVSEEGDKSDPWNWPKLLLSSQNRKTQATTMNKVRDDSHGRALTKRQLGAIRKIVCRPPKHSAEGRSKPIQPPTQRSIVLDVKPWHSNTPSEVSEDQNARSAWNYPRLEAQPQQPPSRPNTNKKRESKMQKAESVADIMPGFFNIQEDSDSHHSEPEVIPEPAPKSQMKPKGKQKVKQNGNQNSKQNTKHSKQKPASLPQQQQDDFHASQMYGGYGEGTSTERAQLPTELHAESPTPSSKIGKWDMIPHSSPPLGPNTPASIAGSGGDWAAPGLFEEPEPEPRAEGSRRSKDSHHGSHGPPSAPARLEDDWAAPDLFEEIGSKHKTEGLRRSRHSHHESQTAPSLAAGSVAWGEPEGVTGAGAEMWAENPAASVHRSRKSSDHRSRKTGSRQSGSRRSMAFGGNLPLDTIFEDAPLESPRPKSDGRISRHSQVGKSDGRRSRFSEALDDWDQQENSGSKHGLGSKRSASRQLRAGEIVNDWDQSEKLSSRQGSGSKRIQGHGSRSGGAVDEWDRPEKPASRQGSHSKSDGLQSRHDEIVDDWEQPEKPTSGQSSHSKSEGRRSRHSAAAGDWDGEVLSQHGSKSDGRRSRHSQEDACAGWDANEQVNSQRGSVAGESLAGWDAKEPSNRLSQVDGDWENTDRPPSKHSSGSRSHRSGSHKTPSLNHSRHHEELDDDRRSKSHSHQSSFRSHKTSSRDNPSASRSPSKKVTIAGSYIGPTVEEDPTNWHGWNGSGEKPSSRRSKSRSHKSQSEAAVEEWLGFVKGKNTPTRALSIGSTATSTTSADPYAPSIRNDPLEAWSAGKVPSDTSVGTGYGGHRSSAVGSGYGAPPGFVAGSSENWSQSGRVEGETGKGSCAGGSRHSFRRSSLREEAAAGGGWDTQTSGGSRHSSRRGSAGGEAQAGAGWDTQTSSSREGVSKVSSRRSSAQGGGVNWSQSGRVEGETGRGSSADGSRHSSRRGSLQQDIAAGGGWDTQTSSSHEKASRRSSSARRDVSPVYGNDRGDEWDAPARSSRHSAGSRMSKRSVAQDDDWGGTAQDDNWGEVPGAPQDGGGWGDDGGVGGVEAGAEQWSDNAHSRLSGSRGSSGSKKAGNIPESFF